MKAVVTGGGGFIGTNLGVALLERGWAVTVIDDFSSGFRANLPLLTDAKVVEGDIRDPSTLKEPFRGADVVFHLAASVGNKRSIENPRQDSEVNAVGTVNVLETARLVGVTKVILASSAGIFGEVKELPIGESHATAPETPYGVSKLAAEKMALAYSALYDLEAICLRYFNIYGPLQRFDAYGNAIPIFLRQLLLGEPLTVFGDGEQTRDFLNVADVVQANLLAFESNGISGVFNISSGEAITINRLLVLLGNVSGIEPEIQFGPPRPGDVRHSLGDISAARGALGYSPEVGLEEGLSEYIDWTREDMEMA